MQGQHDKEVTEQELTELIAGHPEILAAILGTDETVDKFVVRAAKRLTALRQKFLENA